MHKLTNSQARKFNAFYLNLRRAEDRRVRTQNATKTILSEPICPEEVTLDDKNYGIPPENSGITEAKNWLPFPLDIPKYKVDKNGKVTYNFAWVKKLEQVLGRRCPTIQELIAAINKNPDNFRDYAGIRGGLDGKSYDDGSVSYYWSSDGNNSDDSLGPHFAYCAELNSHNPQMAFLRIEYIGSGMSVRFVSDKA